MDCSCIAVYVDEGFDDGGYAVRVSGTERTCVECGRQIELGEQYEVSWVAMCDENGDLDMETFQTFDACLDCVSVRDAFFCDGWYYGRIWEDVEEHLAELVGDGEIPKASCMMSLTKGARDRVCDAIDQIWSELEEDEDDDASA